MRDDIFDNYIKSKLENHSSSVPEGLWEKIIADERRKPAAFWWFYNNTTLLAVAGVVSFICLILGITYFNHPGNSTANKFVDTINKLVKEEKSITKSSTESTISASSNTPFHKETQSKNVDVVEINSTKEVNDLSIRSDEKVETKEVNKNYSLKSHLTDKQQFYKLNRKTSFESDGSTDIKNKETLSNRRIEDEVDNQINGTSANSNKLKDKNIHKKGFKSSIIPNRTYNLADIDSTEVVVNNSNVLLASLNIPTYDDSLYDMNETKCILDSTNSRNTYTKCPTSNFRNDWYVELFSSPEWTTKQIISSGVSTAYLQKKDSSEKMQTGFSAGFRISKNITEHIMLKTGLQFTQMNEYLSIRKENERTTTTVIVKRQIQRSNGRDTTINDTSSVVNIGYKVIKGYNHYSNLEIPFILGYEFGNNKENNWMFSLNGGLIVNATSWYSGSILDTTYNVISINDKSNSIKFKQDIGFSLYADATILKNISPNIDLFANPYIKLGLINSVKTNIGYAEKFNSFGLSFGIRMKINNYRQRY